MNWMIIDFMKDGFDFYPIRDDLDMVDLDMVDLDMVYSKDPSSFYLYWACV